MHSLPICTVYTDNKMLGLTWERAGPLVVGAASAALVLWRGEHFFATAAEHKWHLDALYASVFNIAAAASAFLFAFYTYVRTAEGRILREIRGSGLFRRASRFMIRTIINSAVLAMVTVPLVVAVPEPHETAERWFWIVVVWAAYSGYVFAAIARSVYHFIAIMEAAFGDRLAG
jgi:hypothetical protein